MRQVGHARAPTDSKSTVAIGALGIYDQLGQHFTQSAHLFALCAVPGVGKLFHFTVAGSATIVPEKDRQGYHTFLLGHR